MRKIVVVVLKKGTACALLSDDWYTYSHRQLNSNHREWMATLPRWIEFGYGGKRFAVIHGGVNQINRFLFASTSEALKNQELDQLPIDGLIGGHCGLPFSQTLHHRLWHNPGVIGMPANDGTPRVWYSHWSLNSGQITIQHRALDYDVSQAQTQMVQAHLKNGYREALKTGLWPSMDVLPEVEKMQQGQTLMETVLYF